MPTDETTTRQDAQDSSRLTVGRLLRFARKPLRQQMQSIGTRYLRWFPGAVLPIHLPIRAWWLAENDFMGASILWDGFENSEYELAGRLVRRGMTVLDIGAHKGYYSLLFSRKVGEQGRVLSFEPSQREGSRLKTHLRINSCTNVKVFEYALGQTEGETQLFVADRGKSGLNSLRPPNDTVPTHPENVRIRVLDMVLSEEPIERVDFVKIDVEGAELSVFSGSTELLSRVPRPMILAEVSDIRTKPWGHTAGDLLAYLEGFRFKWFEIGASGTLAPADRQKTFYDGNFLAVPQEKIEILHDLL
jgi:FkbM family methyltransferase